MTDLIQVRTTMRGIKHVLTERWYSYEDARKLAADDPKLRRLLDENGEGNVEDVEEEAFEDASSPDLADEGMFRDKAAKTIVENPAQEPRLIQEPAR